MHGNAYVPEKETKELYQLLLGIKGPHILLNTAECLPSLYNGIYLLQSRCTCLPRGKRKNRDPMKITLNLACRLFLCIFVCGFVLFCFSLALSKRRKNSHHTWQLSLQRPILSQAISVHHYTA